MEFFEFRWSVVPKYYPWIIQGLRITILMTVVSVCITLVLGLVIALCRMSKFRPLSAAADAYIQFFRGMPLFVFLIWLYYGVAMLIGFTFPAMVAGIISLSLLHSAYLAETYRAGIEAVGRGQREAALSVGLKQSQVLRYVVLPQAIRTIFPPMINEFTEMFKSTSILGLVGTDELVRKVMQATSLSYRPFELYTFLALIYIVGVTIVSRIAGVIERRYRYVR